MTDVEEWTHIPEFPNYDVSSYGRIRNRRTGRDMIISYTDRGYPKITLTDEWTGERFTRSVARIVAQSFCKAPNLLCDAVLALDGVPTHIQASNLVWRPEWFVKQYTRQLKKQLPRQYHNLPVYDVVHEEGYSNVVEAGMTQGLLFEHVWRSTYTGSRVFPNGSIFEIAHEML